MKTKQSDFAVRTSVAAVRAALVALAAVSAAQAAEGDDAARLLTKPNNYVEAGGAYVTKDSSKFGEYNSLFNKGFYGILNFDVRGGGSYDSGDPTRWRVTGTDLGLDTRNVSAEYSQQGRFRINFGYDQLRRNRSDSYQTPYDGAGTNNLTLPGNWIVPVVPVISATTPNARGLSPEVAASRAIVGGVVVSPSAANLATSATLISTDLPDFHDVDLNTKRTRYDGGFRYDFNDQLDFQASVRHEHKDGLKPMGTVSRNARFGTTSPSLGDISTVIPDLIDTDTDQFNVSLNWKVENAFLQATYYGSIFRNHVSTMSWQNWATGPTGSGTVNTMSSAPSNEFHQFGLTGGYKFSPTTKLVVNASYARNTQNDAFDISNNLVPVLPAGSLNGLVVTTDVNAKLTARPMTNLNLTANYKYDKRDNRTSVNIYQFADAGDPTQIVGGPGSAPALFPAGPNNPLGPVLANNANANRPYSKKINQFNFDADYGVARGQWVKGGYDFQKIDRWCNGTWIDCADAATTKEHTARVEWRTDAMANLSARIGYARSWRRVDNYNEDAFLALVPYANVVPVGQTISAYQALLLSGLTGYGPVSGLNGGVFAGTGLTAAQAAFFFPNNNALANVTYANQNRISELIGMRRFFVADRDRDKVRSLVNWQANEQLSVQGGVDFNRDDFINSVYGLQDAKSWALNLEGSYAASAELVASVFYTYEELRATTAGNGYTANSTATSVNGFTAISGGCFATIALRNASNKIDPCNNWTTDQRDKVHTLGIEVAKKNLMAGKLDVLGSLIFTRARSDNNPSGGTYNNNPFAVTGAPAGTIAAFYVPTQPLPTITTDTIELRLNSIYTLDKASAVRVLYTFGRMKSADYAYDAMRDGGIIGQFPTFEQPFNYKVHVVGASYIYRWQ